MDEKYKKNFIHAGALAREVRAFGKSLIKTGASYNEIIAQINQKIVQLKVRAAFPPQIALDHVAAHYLPMPGEDIVLSTVVVKLDIGVIDQGWVGDTATTIPVGAIPNPPHQHRPSDFMFVREGTIAFEHDGKSEHAGPGSIILAASQTNHTIRNVGEVPARYFVISIGRETAKQLV